MTLLKQMYLIVLVIISPPCRTNHEDINYGHHVHTRIMIRVESMQHGSEAYFNHRGLLPVRYYISIMYVQECSHRRYYIGIQYLEACFPKPSTKSRWSSGLRRQFQVLVRKGVGLNPTLDINISPVWIYISISITLAI